MNVLSAFDGISCGAEAFKRAGLSFNSYYSFEIDKWAQKISEKNYPEIIRLGDITKYDFEKLKDKNITTLLGGSPCQGFSFAGKRLDFEDPRSRLFFKFEELLKAVKPKYFLLENVKMKKESQDIISERLGVEPVEINSALLSAQNRRRLYWTNIPFDRNVKDNKIFLRDILESEFPSDIVPVNYSSSGRAKGAIEGRYYKSYKAQTLTASGYGKKSSTAIYQINPDRSAGGKQPYMQDRIYHVDGKSVALTSSFASRLNISNGHLGFYRKLSCRECERLQTLPDDYTLVLDDNGNQVVSNHQRYKALGNGWTVDVIAHILRGLK